MFGTVTVDPSPCWICGTVLEAFFDSPRVKTLGACKLHPAQWCFARAFVLGFRVFLAFVWMERHPVSTLAPIQISFLPFCQHKDALRVPLRLVRDPLCAVQFTPDLRAQTLGLFVVWLGKGEHKGTMPASFHWVKNFASIGV